MKQFMMLFIDEKSETPTPAPSPEQMQVIVGKWQDWLGGIAAQGKFVSSEALGPQQKTLHPNKMITDGPYAEVKEIVGGYAIVKADNIDDATALADGCPILANGGKVEVRDVMVFDM